VQVCSSYRVAGVFADDRIDFEPEGAVLVSHASVVAGENRRARRAQRRARQRKGGDQGEGGASSGSARHARCGENKMCSKARGLVQNPDVPVAWCARPHHRDGETKIMAPATRDRCWDLPVRQASLGASGASCGSVSSEYSSGSSGTWRPSSRLDLGTGLTNRPHQHRRTIARQTHGRRTLGLRQRPSWFQTGAPRSAQFCWGAH
jgi:hypothetical protein